MLPAKNRLKLSENLSSKWPEKKEIFTPVFKVVYHFLSGEREPKLGFIVTGRVGKASKRNKIRRLLAESIRNKISKLPKGTEAVIILGRPVEENSYETIDTLVDSVISKINQPKS